MGKRLEDLKLNDEPLGGKSPAMPQDLFAFARGLAADMKHAPTRDKTVIALYRTPDYLRWGVESLSEQATGGVLEPAATALLSVGLSTIWGFPGVHEICAARLTVLPLGDAQTMGWFGNFPVVSVPAADTDDSRVFRLHVPTSLTKKLAKLARSLGMSISRLGTFALMAGLLQAPSCSAPKYRKAMVRTLQRLKTVIKRRGVEADTRAADAAPRDASKDHLWTIADLLGPGADDDAGDDD